MNYHLRLFKFKIFLNAQFSTDNAQFSRLRSIIKKCRLHDEIATLNKALAENDELVLILFKSIQTAKLNSRKS